MRVLWQVMREASYGRAHKAVIRKRMDEVLTQCIFVAAPPPDNITHFMVQEDESLVSIVDQLKRDCPRWCRNREQLLERVAVLLG
jgi:hypothetical protein